LYSPRAGVLVSFIGSHLWTLFLALSAFEIKDIAVRS